MILQCEKIAIFNFIFGPSVKKMANWEVEKKVSNFSIWQNWKRKKKKKPASKLVTVKQNIDKTKYVSWNQGSRGWEGRSRQASRQGGR